jgi:hypothetical protein
MVRFVGREVVGDDILVGGIQFMQILTNWSRNLRGRKVLRIKYCFSVEEDVCFIVFVLPY